MAKPKWKKGNRSDVVAALNKSLKHLPKLTAKNFASALGTEFEFKMNPLGGVGGPGCPLIWKPLGGTGGGGCPQIWKPLGGTGGGGCPQVWKPLGGTGGGGCQLVMKPMGVGGGNCHLIMNPVGGIAGSHCAPTAPGAPREALELHLRSLVKSSPKKKSKKKP